MTRSKTALALLLLILSTQACLADGPTEEKLRTAVVGALDSLVAGMVAEQPADANG